MNKSQNSKLQAWLLLRVLCNANILIWQVLAAFVTCFTVFSSRLDKLIENARIQEELLNGFTRQKQQSKSNMAKFANALRLKIQAYASSLDPEDNILYAKVNYSLSKLMGMSAPNAMAACNTILKLTEEHETALIPFGVQPTDSLIMTDLIQDFVSKMTMPRQGIAELKGLTARIKEDVSYIDSLISKRMGKLMINFVQSAPVFYNNFMNFKRPVAGPTHFTELDIFTKNKQTGEPLKGVFITAVGTTKTYRGKSETSGELPLKKIAPELYDIVFEFPGFQPLTLNAQKAIIGEQVKIIAELIPIS